MEQSTARKETDSIVDEMVERCLTDWAGLRDYLRQRRAGRPADAALETLVEEVLRQNLHRGTDVRGVIRYMVKERM
jgi:hypothetical protein